MDQVPIRKLKRNMRVLLFRPDLESALEEILALPPRRAVNPLFSFLYDGDPLIRWRAVTALGAVTAALADREIESARVVFRRLMWNLNDESGGIGWGSPEVMGEIVARSSKMRSEYLMILLSYLRPDGNYLEHEGLQKGVLWAVGRAAEAGMEEPIREVAPLVRAHLASENAELRGAAAWACGGMVDRAAVGRLRQLARDPAEVDLWIDRRLCHLTVGEAARLSLEKIRCAGSADPGNGPA